MAEPSLTWMPNYLGSIADDVLRGLFVRGKNRDMILPMVDLKRLDTALEATKQAVIDMKVQLDKAGVINQEAALTSAAGRPLRLWWREGVEIWLGNQPSSRRNGGAR